MPEQISFVIPVHNEEGNIVELYNRLKNILVRDFSMFNGVICFVDDGSTDNSLSILTSLHESDNRVKIIKLSRNFGQHVAIKAGLDNVNSDYVVLLDADLQDDPDNTKQLFVGIKEGYDIVIGVRARRNDPLLKKINSAIFFKLMNSLSDIKMIPNQTMLRIFNHDVLNVLQQMGEVSQNNGAFLAWMGFKQKNVIVSHHRRLQGKTSYSFMRSLSLAIDTILTFSNKPLIQISVFGIVVSCASLIFTIYVIVRNFFYSTPIGWSSIVSIISFIGGVIIFSLGIVGIYIAKLYRQSLNRPLYIISDKLI